MAVEDSLRFLGAPARVRDALGILPPEIAEAVAAEACRIVEAEAVPVRPAGDEADAPLPAGAAAGGRWGWIVAGGVESLPVIRWRLVWDLLRLEAGRLAVHARGFRAVREAWEAAHGRRLVPSGADWPPLPVAPFVPGDEA